MSAVTWLTNRITHFSLRRLLVSFLATIGSLWLAVEVVSFFSATARESLPSKGCYFLAIGLLVAIVRGWPKLRFQASLADRDTTIELRVCDAFSVNGTLVVPTNTKFHVNSPEMLRVESIQTHLIRHYYDNDPRPLSQDIQEALRNTPHSTDGRYATGTVAIVRRKKRQFYLLASTHLNDHQHAVGSVEEIRSALATLWTFISERGEKGEVIIPILGTGHARLAIRREQVIQDIIRSFIAGCASKTFCDRLVIAVHPRDVQRYKVNLDDLSEFLYHVCKYAQFAAAIEPRSGQPVDESENATRVA